MTPKAPSPEGLRHDYEHSLFSIAMLAAKYRLSRAEISDFRVAEKWTARESTIAAANAYRLAAAVSRLEIKSAPPPRTLSSTGVRGSLAPSPPVGEGRGGGIPPAVKMVHQTPRPPNPSAAPLRKSVAH